MSSSIKQSPTNAFGEWIELKRGNHVVGGFFKGDKQYFAHHSPFDTTLDGTPEFGVYFRKPDGESERVATVVGLQAAKIYIAKQATGGAQ